MLQRTLSFSALAAAALTLSACGGGTSTPIAQAPTGPAPSGLPATQPQIDTAVLGGFVAHEGLTQSALALYTVDIDPASLSATAHLKETRSAQANDDLYLLSIENFLTAASFKIVGVGSTINTIELTWELVHPFPACLDPAGTPNGSTNRADLGIAGQIAFLTDVVSATDNTYFDEGAAGSVVANTTLVANPDAFIAPAGLITLSGAIANTFPAQSLVDETANGTGSRIGVSNAGNVTGNFGTDGWTRAEMGATRDQWSGFGTLHQGQRTSRTVSLDRAGLIAAGGFSLDIAVLAKYNDPRGGATATAKKANRLPPAAADATKFAYRHPHGALDVEQIVFEGASVPFQTNLVSASTLEFHVTDSDARATASTQTDLSLDTDVTKVAQGEEGLPELAVCIPGVLGDATTTESFVLGTDVVDDDSADGGDAAQDSGRPGDALYYSRSVTKLVTAGQTDGTYTGLVRARDVEADLPAPLAIALNGVTLAPLSTNLPEPISYQAFEVDLVTPNNPPTLSLSTPASVLSGTTTTISVVSANDAQNQTINVELDWNNDGTYEDSRTIAPPYTPIVWTRPASALYINTDLTPDPLSFPVRFNDGVVANIAYAPALSATLGANRPPQISAGTMGLAGASLPTPATFSVTQTGLTVTDPESNPISYSVTGTPNSGAPVTQTAIAFPVPIGSFTNPPVTSVTFAGYATDPLHPGVAGTLIPTAPSPLTGTVTVGGCGLSMAAVDCTLTTLTTGSIPRSGTAVQAITGVRVGWTDIAGEAQYAIQRATWAPTATVASLVFSTIGTAVTGATSFDDTTITPTGTRYMYRVMPRCSVGGPDIATPSQLAMVALQNFEGEPLNASLNTTLPPTALANDWVVNCATPNVNPTVPYSQVSIVDAAGGAISGTRGFYIPEVHESSPSNTQGWETLSPPGINDRANFLSIAVSRLELNHGGNDFSGTSGYTFLTNASRPANGLPLPAGPNTWAWIPGPALTGRTYTDNNASSFTTFCYPNITTVAGGSVLSGTTMFHFGDLAAPPVPMHPPGFSAFNAAFGTFGSLNHDFVFLCTATADNSRVEGVRYDDIAWIVY